MRLPYWRKHDRHSNFAGNRLPVAGSRLELPATDSIQCRAIQVAIAAAFGYFNLRHTAIGCDIGEHLDGAPHTTPQRCLRIARSG